MGENVAPRASTVDTHDSRAGVECGWRQPPNPQADLGGQQKEGVKEGAGPSPGSLPGAHSLVKGVGEVLGSLPEPPNQLAGFMPSVLSFTLCHTSRLIGKPRLKEQGSCHELTAGGVCHTLCLHPTPKAQAL